MVYYLTKTFSTNAWAKAHPHAGRDGGVWAVYTLDQTDGRGRMGRSWLAAPNTCLCYTAVAPWPAESLQALPLLAGLVVCAVLERRYALGARLKLKWPNDVLFDGKKLAGILCEGISSPPRAIVGIGLNLCQTQAMFACAGLLYATSLAAQGVPVNAKQDARAIAQMLTNAFVEQMPLLRARGFSPYRAQYEERCVTLGRHVSWDGGGGVAQGVEEDGGLLVACDGGGVARRYAGEVNVQGVYASPSRKRQSSCKA